MAHFYKYSLVRLVPDAARGEAVNIGLIVFRPERLDVRMLKSMRKAQALNGNLETQHLFDLHEALTSIDNVAASVESRFALIREFGMVTLSELGEFSASNDQEYNTVVARLMSRLVTPVPPKRTAATRNTRLLTDIKKHFSSKKLLGQPDEIDNHKIVPNFPISEQEQLYADLALRNSVMHIAETVDFRVNSGITTAKFKEAGLAAVTLDQGKRVFGADTKRYFLYAARPSEERLISAHLAVAEQYADKVLNYESASDRQVFLTDMYAAAGIQH